MSDRRTIVVAAASFTAMGAGTSLPGALLPEFIDQFALSPFGAGTILAMVGIGYLVSVLGTPKILSGRGVRPTARDGLILYTAASILLALAPQTWTLGVALLALGLGFGATDVSINALFASRSNPRTTNVLNLVHLFFGVGAFALPAVATVVLAYSWGWPLLCLLLAIASAGAALGWHLLDPATTILEETEPDPTAGSATRSRAVLLFALVLGLYVGAEVGLGSWIAEAMVSLRSVPIESAAATLSGYWLGLAVGRLILSALAHRIGDRLLLLLSALAAIATVWAALEVREPAVAAACFFATGLAFAGIFPSIIALTGRAYPTDVPRATSIVIAASAIGGILLPWLMSLVSEGAGIAQGMFFYLWVIIAMLGAIVLAIRKAPDQD